MVRNSFILTRGEYCAKDEENGDKRKNETNGIRAHVCGKKNKLQIQLAGFELWSGKKFTRDLD